MKKILIIDDEQYFTAMVKLNLEKTGKYQVFVENNSQHGLGAAKEINPELILLDILMPGIDGFKLLEMLKNDDATISIPVIMLTAVRTQEAKDATHILFDEGYLEKPISAEDLEVEIDRVLDFRKK